jgi:hypothetical protein
MRNTSINVYGKIFVFGVVLFMVGCVSDPVQTYLPANHPANPDSAEAVYTVAPNPFKDTLSMDEMKSSEVLSMSHKGHEDDSSSHKMKPMLDKGHNDPENSTGAETEKSDRQHQEHD